MGAWRYVAGHYAVTIRDNIHDFLGPVWNRLPMTTDEFKYTIWFKNSKVRGLTAALKDSYWIDLFDWGQMPSDLDEDINVNTR